MSSRMFAFFSTALLFVPALLFGQYFSSTTRSPNLVWSAGSPDCSKSSDPPLQVQHYDDQTFILRENLCSTFEAPFVYLLVGSEKVMLIDTGDVSDPAKMPLAKTVQDLRASVGRTDSPLLVVHTHRHLDHRSGDGQFANFPNAQVVGFDIDSVRRFYGFTNWPDGIAQIDLGNRTVDVIPTPGHNETEVSFYDRDTSLLFTGDFLMPGRLLVDDSRADLGSAERLAGFVKDRPVSYVLGGHIEENDQGQLYDWQSTYHPREHGLQLSKADLLALPEAVHQFNGFYSRTAGFVMMNSMRLLMAFAAAIILLLAGLAVALTRYLRRRHFRKVHTAKQRAWR